MLVVHWQHSLTKRKINIFQISALKIPFTVFFIVCSFIFPIDYIVRYIFTKASFVTLWQAFYVTINRISCTSVCLVLLGFPSKSVTTTVNEGKATKVKVFQYPKAFNIFTYFSKLNYSVFCVHVTIGNYIVAKRILNSDKLGLGSIVCSVFVWTMLAALALNLFIEQPAINIYNYVIKKRKND